MRGVRDLRPLNVAVAGSIVMHDRLAKRRRAAAEELTKAKSRSRRRLR